MFKVGDKVRPSWDNVDFYIGDILFVLDDRKLALVQWNDGDAPCLENLNELTIIDPCEGMEYLFSNHENEPQKA